MKLAFIGGGVMAEAIIGGVLASNLTLPEDVSVGEPVNERRDQLTQTHGLNAFADNAYAIRGADLVILAVKPQSLPEVMPSLSTSLSPQQTVASIVAGATIETLVNGLEQDSVVRIMPNTPAQIGAGMSVWTATAAVPGAMRHVVGQILQTLGDEVYVPDEKLIDMSTALSASGPAYVFLFIEALIDAGVYLGMARDMARRLALQTVLGSAQLVQETGRHPAELKDMVTSPGGTTIAALRAMESGGFRAAIFDGVIAAFDKSEELGKK